MNQHLRKIPHSLEISEIPLFLFWRNSGSERFFLGVHLFPIRLLLTNNVFEEKSKNLGMKLDDVHEFGLDYADTLKMWRENFNRARPQVLQMGFDEKFIRLWNLYLSYCEGAFRAKRINVGQFLMAR